MEERRPSVLVALYLATTHALGLARWLFVPVGIAALVAMGVHLASDLFDEAAFHTLNLADTLAESCVRWLLERLGDLGLVSPAWVDEHAFAFADLVDVEHREAWSRWVALAVELLVDLRLVRIALGYREAEALRPLPLYGTLRTRLVAWRERERETTRGQLQAAKRYLGDLTVEKLYLPFSTLLAVIAGTYAVSLGVENALFANADAVAALARHPYWASTVPAWVVGALVAQRVALPGFVHAFDYVAARDARARELGMSNRRRRLRGLVFALVMVPLLTLGVLVGTPLVRLLSLNDAP